MEDIQANSAIKFGSISAARAAFFVAMVAVAVVIPFAKFQPVVGSVVNATLFLSVYYLGISGGIMVGLLPSVISLSVGLLPLVLAPVIPFIMLSNALLAVVFGTLRMKTLPGAVFVAALAKFVFLWSLTYLLAGFLTQSHGLQLVAKMFGPVQFLTAFAGGLVFLVAIKAQSRYFPKR